MKKRVLSLVLTLCMLLGLLPTAVFAAPAAEPAAQAPAEIAEVPEAAPEGDDTIMPLAAESRGREIAFYTTLGTTAGYYGNDISSFDATEYKNSNGGYEQSQFFSVIVLKEPGRRKPADYCLLPFTIDVRIPAYSSCTVDFTANMKVLRNCNGNTGYFMELLKGDSPSRDFLALNSYNTGLNANPSYPGMTLARVNYADASGGTVEKPFSITFTNLTDKWTTVSHPMAFYVGVHASTSTKSSYQHCVMGQLFFTQEDCSYTYYKATVNGTPYLTLEEAVNAYNATSGATLQLQQNATGNVTLTKPGTFDLNGKTLTGNITVNSTGDVTVKGGYKVDATTTGGHGIHHTGSGTLTLTGYLRVNANANNYGVRNDAGKLVVEDTVTISPNIHVGGAGVTLNGAGPKITAADDANDAHLYIQSPLTLGGTLNKDCRVYFYNAATADAPITVSTNGATADNIGKFTDWGGNYSFFAQDGKIVARPARVTFDPAGGTVSPTAAAIQGGKATAWPTPTRAGYTFNGWDQENSGFTGDATVTAQWTPAVVNVKFNANGGTCTTTGKDYYIGNKYIDLPTATRTGYTFGGWYTAASGGTEVTGSTTVTNTAAHTLYARWTRDQFTVSFDGQGGTATPASKQVYYNDRLGGLPTATKTGYTFAGWYTAADGGTKIDANQVITGNMTYYARWTPVKVQLNYNANGGVLSGSAIDQVTYGMAYGDLPGVGGVGGAPTRTGYTFTGWATTAAGGTGVTKDTVCHTTEPITIYAQWSADPVTVTYDVNGGSALSESSKTLTFGGNYQLPTQPSRTGYTFEGWFTVPTGGTKVEDTTPVTNPSAHTLYAQWTANTYRVTYYVNGGNALDPNSKTVTYDQPYGELPTPTRNRYTFLGWFTAVNGGDQVTAGNICKLTRNQILYARWQPTNVTVSLRLNLSSGSTVTLKPAVTQFVVPYGKPYGEGTYTQTGETKSMDGKLPVGIHGDTSQVFLGWYTAASGGTQVTANNVYTGNSVAVELYAHWAAKHEHMVGDTLVDFGPETYGVSGISGGNLTANTYFLGNDLNLTSTLKVTSGTVNLCLNGHHITSTASPIFSVSGTGVLNICDCKGTGTVTTSGSGVCIAVGGPKNYTGTANLYGGTFTAKHEDCSDVYGTMLIDGATLISEKDNDGNAVESAGGSGSTITIKSGKLTGNRAIWVGYGTTVNITGGTLVSNGNHEASTAEGNSYQQACGIFVSGGKLNFSGGSLTAYRGIMAQGPTNISGNAEVSLTSPAWGVYVYNTTLTMTGGTVSSKGLGVVSNGESAVANISGGTITGSATNNTNAGLSVSSGGELTLSGTANVSGYTGASVGADGTLNVTGGTITATGNGGFGINNASTVTVEGGTISGAPNSGNGCAIWNTGTATINGGSLNGNFGVIVQGGTATVTGGTLNGAAHGMSVLNTSTATLPAGSTASINGSSSGSGVEVGADASFTMEGGTVTGGTVGIEAKGTTTVTGGTVTSTGSHGILSVGTTKISGDAAVNNTNTDASAAGRGVTVNGGVTTIEGGSITSTGSTKSIGLKVENVEGAALIMKGGSITGTHRGISNNQTVTLSNGTVTATGTEDSPMGMDVGSTGTTTMTGGDVSGRYGAVVYGALNLGGGSITGAGSHGIENSSSGTVNMTGGSVTCKAEKYSDGILNYGAVNISGGSVKGMHRYGVNNQKDLTVTGGTIAGPDTTEHAIYQAQGTLKLTGGTIIGSYYGLYVAEVGPSTFTLGGSPVIQNERFGDIGLAQGRVITLSSENALAADAKFSVGLFGDANQPTEGSPIAITGNNGADGHDHFTAANAAYGVQSGDGNVVQLYKAHKHPICGETCTHTPAHETVEFFPLVLGENGVVANGNYYLTGDMNSTFDIPEKRAVNICLNGHTNTVAHWPNCVHYDAVLNLSDCSEAHTGGLKSTDVTNGALNGTGTFNQYGGTISAAEKPVKLEGETRNGTWNFYGGALACNDSTKTPVIEPVGQVNLLADAGKVRLSFNDKAGPVRIGTRPNTPYAVTSTVFPVTVAAGLPEGAAVGDCFTTDNDKLVLEAAEGQVILRTHIVNVKETASGEVKLILSANANGKLTADQIAEPWDKVGYIWDGYYSTATGGSRVVAEGQTVAGQIKSIFNDGDTIYPRWTECAHDHEGDAAGKTTVEPTCLVKGSESFTCASCGLSVTNELPLAEHTFDAAWSHNGDNHWHGCTAEGCTARKDEAAHTWGAAPTTAEGIDDEGNPVDKDTYTCSVCSATKTETVPKYTYTFFTDAYSNPSDQVEQAAAVRAGTEITLPADVTRTGYTLQGWVEVPTGGEAPSEPAPAAETGETALTGAYTMPTRNVAFQVKWARIDNYEVKSGDTVVLEDGSIVTNTDGTVTVQKPDSIKIDDQGNPVTIPGGTTTITLPGGGSATITQGEDGKDQFTVPDGSTVVTTNPTEDGSGTVTGPTITVKGGEGTVDVSGGVDAPVGSTVAFPDGNKAEITGDKPGVITADGNVSFPSTNLDDPTTGGGTVELTDSTGAKTTVDVDGRGEGLSTETGEAPAYIPENNKAQVGDTIITLPEEYGTDPSKSFNVPDDPTGPVPLPAGSSVDLPDGSTVTLDGEGAMTVDPDTGNVTIPAGNTATVTDKDGSETTVKVPEGSETGTVSNDGDITLPAGGTVTVEDGEGGHTTITAPTGGGTVAKNDDGTLTAPEGSTVTTPDGTEIEITSGTNATVDPATGAVTLPSGGAVIVTPPGGQPQTVSIESGETVKPEDYNKPAPPAPSHSGSDSSPTTYQPATRQPEHGTITVSPARPEKGDKVTVAVKAEDGYVVDTVTVTDRNGKSVQVTQNPDGTYTFIQPAGKVTISAEMRELASGYAGDSSCPLHSYADADAAAWYHDGVHYCLEKGLMQGYGGGRFAPNEALSRAMLAQILYNQAGRPAVTAAGTFADVPGDAWYADAVNWAAAQGIVTGYGNGDFGPQDPITREQLAVMLYRCEQRSGQASLDSPPENWGDFTDADEASSWGVEALKWGVERNIIRGKNAQKLAPKAQATRAEAATMLMRYLEKK